MRRDELPALAAELARPYRIAPPRLPAGGRPGGFVGVRDGQSVDFHDYRQYHPGDDPRRVDWRAYARNGQLQLKLFREEVSPVVEIHLDTSGSMSAYPGKETTAVFMAAFLGAATLAAEGRAVLCRDGRRFAGGEFPVGLTSTRFAGDGGMLAAMSPGSRPLRILLSDFLWENGAEAVFRRFAEGGVGFVPLLLASRSEIEPPWRGRTRLRESENAGRTLDLDVDGEAVAAYKARLRRHWRDLDELARTHRAGLLRLECPDGEPTRDDLTGMVRRLAGERVVTAR